MRESRVEVGGNKEELFLKLREIMKVFKDYNSEHNFGSMMASAMMEGFDKKGARSLEDKRTKALSNALKARDAASDLGLELDFGSKKGITMFVQAVGEEPETSNPPELSMSIMDGGAFVKFLKKIDKVDFEKYSDLKNDILIIIKDATKQIADPASSEEKIAPLVASGIKILHEFERLGFGKNTENLAESLMGAQGKTLNELRALRAARCLDKPDAKVFGPSDWHTDMSIEGYQKKWAETKRVVLETLQNKNAAMLARRAAENLIANADYAIKNMEDTMEGKNPNVRPELIERYKISYPEYIKTCQKYKAEYQDILSKMEKPELN